jgi:hypothetical protein
MKYQFLCIVSKNKRDKGKVFFKDKFNEADAWLENMKGYRLDLGWQITEFKNGFTARAGSITKTFQFIKCRIERPNLG